MRQGEWGGVSWLHPSTPVGFSHAAKNKWLDLPGRHQGRQQKAIFGKHFLPPDIMLWGRRRFPPQDRTGVLGITGYRSSGAPSGKSPGLVRKSHIFHRKNSISCHSNCLQQEQVTLPGGEAYGEIRSPPKAPGTKASRCTHTRRGRSLSAQGDQEAPWVPTWCRLPALSKLTPGSSVSRRETCDVVVNCVSPLHGTAAPGLLV